MLRVLLTVLLPLLLPTALYLIWVMSLGRAEITGLAAAWRRLPWPWLVLAGAALAAAVLFAFVQFGNRRNGVYIPPQVENGHIVPGHFAAPPR